MCIEWQLLKSCFQRLVLNIFSFTMRADGHTQATEDSATHLFRPLHCVDLAFLRSKAHFTGFPSSERLAGECFCRANIHTTLAFSACLLNQMARW